MPVNRFFSTLLCSSALALSACSPNVETRGHVQEPDWKQQITVGTTTRDDVFQLLGSPSTTSSFGSETWYFITAKRENFAFLKPEIADQEVIAISFDTGGVVSNVQEVGREAMRDDVEFSERKTPTEGHSMTFIEQLLGNAGRFNRPDSGARGVGSNRPGGR